MRRFLCRPHRERELIFLNCPVNHLCIVGITMALGLNPGEYHLQTILGADVSP